MFTSGLECLYHVYLLCNREITHKCLRRDRFARGETITRIIYVPGREIKFLPLKNGNRKCSTLKNRSEISGRKLGRTENKYYKNNHCKTDTFLALLEI